MQLKLSKSLFSVFFLILIASACGLTKKVNQDTHTGSSQAEKDSSELAEIGGELALDTPVFVDTLDSQLIIVSRDTYMIDFLLPVFSDLYPDIKGGRARLSQASLEYWWGAKFAFDTLVQAGLNAEVHLHDTKNDSAEIAAILDKIKARGGSDLFFGPLFVRNVQQLSSYCLKDSANLISPFATIDQCEGFNQRIIFSKPSRAILTEKTVEFIQTNYKDNQKILIYHNENKEDKAVARAIDSLLGDSLFNVQLKEIEGNYVGKGEIKNELPDSAIVLICSDNETLVSSILAELRRSQDNFKVIGREKWLSFKSLDSEAWERLNMRIITSEVSNYYHPFIRSFIQKYRNRHHTEPSRFAVIGYAETILYGLYLYNYGINFNGYLNEIEISLPHLNPRFTQNEECGAYTGAEVNVLKFEAGELIESK